jgi:enediyne polyketide synthase
MLTEEVARQLPWCRALNIEWSAWAAAGMGERLGRLDSLARYGVSAIGIADGVDMLLRLLSHRGADTSVFVAGRLGNRSTLEFLPAPLPFVRFLESPRLHVPRVELIADAALGPSTDPYLRDHCINGQLLFPGVMGLEAMAQCSMALMGTSDMPAFEDVEFHRPVVVGADAPTTVRVLALTQGDGSVRVAIRAASTGFAHDHFSAVCRWPAGSVASDVSGPAAPLGASAGSEALPPVNLYGSLFFQAGRFARVQGYRELFSKRCVADIAGGADAWFGAYLPPMLVLGDPGARDAALHAVQATIPQHRLLPVSVAGIRFLRPLTGPCQVRARQREEHGRDYVWDLEIVDASGAVVEVWTRTRFRALESLAVGGEALELLGPYLERRLPALGHVGTPHVLCVDAARGRARGDEAIRLLLGDGVVLHRRPDGKPEVESGAVSVSHSDVLTLAVAAGVPIGCDVETITPRSSKLWRDLLGGERADVGEWIAREAAESDAVAGTRVWTAIESLKKAGAPPDLALTVGGELADGWVTLKAGRYRVSTWVPPGPANGIALAIATEDTDAQL